MGKISRKKKQIRLLGKVNTDSHDIQSCNVMLPDMDHDLHFVNVEI